jgi:hypothetical protein
MDKQIMLDQRAWVYVEKVDTKGHNDGKTMVFMKESEKSNIKVTIKNGGKTLANVIETKVYANGVETGEKPELSDKAIISSDKTPMAMFPGISGNTELFSETEIFTKDHIEAIKSGQFSYYIYGMITYKDIFNKIHWTKYCYQLAPSLDRFTTCRFYNETDDTQKNR